MNIVFFYKQNLKHLASCYRFAKYSHRRLHRLSSKKENSLYELELKAMQENWAQLPEYLRHIEIRYLYLAYASIRGKDLNKVEVNPRVPHNSEILTKVINKMDEVFSQRGEP